MVFQQPYHWWLAQSMSITNADLPHSMCPHFAAMQTGPTELVQMTIGQADCFGQSDAPNEVQHIQPNFNRHQNNNFSEFQMECY
jgi:hypothetical protein